MASTPTFKRRASLVVSVVLVALLAVPALVDADLIRPRGRGPLDHYDHDRGNDERAVQVRNLTRTLQNALDRILSPSHLQVALDSGELSIWLPSQCQTDLLLWLDGVYRLDTWALQMMDSSSKLVTGVLYGSFADLGNYDECVDSATDNFSGRFFLPAYDVQTYDATTKTWTKLLTLRSSFCLPSTCEAPQVANVIQKGIDGVDALAESSGVRVELRLPKEFTAVKGARRETTSADIGIIVLCVALLSLAVLGTVIDISLPEKTNEGALGYLIAFSLYSNGKGLLKPTRPGPGNIGCLSGLRVLSIFWVVLGHRYKWALDAPFMNLAVMPKKIEDYSKMLIAGAPLAVDTFFAMGGLLVCFVSLRGLDKTKFFNLPHFYIHRYIRLTPAIAIVMAIHATFLDLLGDGPMWYDNLMYYSEQCRRHWWTNLLYIANYYNPTDLCLGHSWYLMVDMQLYWITPLLLVPLWRWPRIGLAWLGLVTAASIAVPFAIAWTNEIRAHLPLDTDQTLFRKGMTLQYTPTHMRASAYFIGILAGYILHLERKGVIKVQLRKMHVAAGWLASTTICLAVLFGAQPILDQQNHPYNQAESSTFIAFHRPAWGVAICWIILACTWGYGGIVNRFLSGYPFQVLGRLTYSLYLVHVVLQTYDFGVMRTPEFYSDFRMVHRAAADVVVSLFFALVLCLVAESPILLLEKKLTGGGGKRRKPRPEVLADATLSPATLTGQEDKTVELIAVS